MAGGFNWKKEGQRRQIERYGYENAESLETAAGPDRGRTREDTGRPAADPSILDKVAASYAARPKVRQVTSRAPAPPGPNTRLSNKRLRKEAKLRRRSLEFVEAYLKALGRQRPSSLPRVVEQDIRAAGGFDAWCRANAERGLIVARVAAGLGIAAQEVQRMANEVFPGSAGASRPGPPPARSGTDPRPALAQAPERRPTNPPPIDGMRLLGPLPVPAGVIAQIAQLADQEGLSRDAIAVRLLLRGLDVALNEAQRKSLAGPA